MTAKAKFPVREEDLQRAVIDLAHTLHLLVAHFRPVKLENGRTITPVAADGKGFPDLVITGPGGVLFRELKAEHAYPTKEQRRWLRELEDAGADVGVWKPWDLRNGTIQHELKRLAKPRAGA